MKRTVPTAVSCAAAFLLASVLAGCSDSSDSSSESGYGMTSSSKTKQATVDTKTAGKLGTILVDDKDRTLYLFLADKKNKSNCTGDCAKAWPPLLTDGPAKAGEGVDKKLLDMTKRSDDTEQVTYNGHPLYYYAGDTEPGQTNGQGLDQFGAVWYVLDAKGKEVKG
ncbi:COG4315 family predicted lipoprotein [Streptomyces flaveolus]|uniref:COG4315 family predicted lipoprotein n=1 Tax=Streptomyces flaveolus TaxID=67297 RepID=UPI0033FD38B4